jgi:hypothetical protein
MPQTRHMLDLSLGTTRPSWTRDEARQSDDWDRGSWIGVARVGVRGRALGAGRPAPAHQPDAGPAAGTPGGDGPVHHRQDATRRDGARHRLGGHPGLGSGLAHGWRHSDCTPQQPPACPDGQDGNRTPGPPRRPNKRGDASARQTMAIPRRQVHSRHPALPGCRDEAVRNSCVQGEER